MRRLSAAMPDSIVRGDTDAAAVFAKQKETGRLPYSCLKSSAFCLRVSVCATKEFSVGLWSDERLTRAQGSTKWCDYDMDVVP